MTVSEAPSARGLRSLAADLDVQSSAADAFELLCSVEKWPVWFSLLRSARVVDPKSPLAPGSEVWVRSCIPGAREELYEVDRIVPHFRLSLVGAYSTRRRIEFRVEQKSSRAKIHVRIAYPAYHGRVGAWVDAVLRGRRLSAALDHSLELFRGMLEYDRTPDALLADL